MVNTAMVLIGAAFVALAVNVGWALFLAVSAGVLTYYGSK